jgi:hypothetical protein
MRRDGSVGIATGYGLWAGGTGFDSSQKQDFPLLHSIQTGSGVHPASYLMGTGALSLGVKRPGREVDHSPHLLPSSRMVELYLHCSLCHHDIVLDQLSTKITLLLAWVSRRLARLFGCLYRYNLIITSFDIFTAITVQIVILRAVAPWSVLGGYQRFRETYCLHLQDWSVGTCRLQSWRWRQHGLNALQSWRWKQHVPPRRRYPRTILSDAITQWTQ